MTAEIVPFPTRLRREAGTAAGPLPVATVGVGDMVVMCISTGRIDGRELWAAWPIGMVDAEGVIVAVQRRDGALIGADRLNCRPDVYGFRASDHEAEAFAAMRWKTFPGPDEAIMAFAGICTAMPQPTEGA